MNCFLAFPLAPSVPNRINIQEGTNVHGIMVMVQWFVMRIGQYIHTYNKLYMQHVYSTYRFSCRYTEWGFHVGRQDIKNLTSAHLDLCSEVHQWDSKISQETFVFLSFLLYISFSLVIFRLV